MNGTNDFLSNPLTSFGMGLLGGNYGPNSKAAFANAMRGGLLGMQQAGVSQARQAQTQAAQQRLLMQQAAAKREKEEREQMKQWAVAKGMDPNMPEWALKAQYEAEVKSQFPGVQSFGTSHTRVLDRTTGNVLPMFGSQAGGLWYVDGQGNKVSFDPKKHKLLEQLTPQNLGQWSVPFGKFSGYGSGGQAAAAGGAIGNPPVGVSQVQTPGGPVTTTNYGTADPAEWQAAMQGMQAPQAPQAPPGAMPILPKQSEMPAFQAEQTARKKEAEIKAASQAQAQVDLPGAELDLELTKDYIKELRSHPGLDSATGWTGAVLPVFPGSARADFEARKEQILGGSFLQAYQQLKGAGQITEVEGKKAENAIGRMQTAVSKTAFLAALKDYERAIEVGFAKLKIKAGSTGSAKSSGGWSIKKAN